MRLNDTTRMFFKRLAAISSPEEAFLFTHLEDPVVGPMAQETLRRKYLQYNSMLRTSISPTLFRAGFRSNVIPGDAEATLDIRAVPDEDMDRLVADLKRLIDDPAVEIVRNAVGRPSPPPSSVESEMFRALERIQAAMFPGAATLPAMLTGATDMSFLRAKGVQSYGISAPALETESGAHSNDERISIEGFGKFVEFVYRCVFEVAAEKSGLGPNDRRIGDPFRAEPGGQAADRAWVGGRQRSLSRHGVAGEQADRAGKILRHDGVSQPHPRHQRGCRYFLPSL
jgi:hypothetical protein